MSDDAARFTVLELRTRTPDLTGPEQAEVFDRLPAVLQAEAWAGLREWTDHRSQRDFEDWCGDDR